MPKRRRKNRPRKRPPHKPVPKKPEVVTVDYARRKLLGLGLGLGAAAITGGIFGVRALLQNDLQTEEASPEYDEWADKIALPQVQLDKHNPKLEGEENYDYFLSPNADRNLISQFYAEYDKLKQKLQHDLRGTNDYLKHISLTNGFLENLNKAFKELNRDTTDSTLEDNVNLITHSLIPHKIYPNIVIRNNRLVHFYLYDVSDIQRLNLDCNDTQLSIPIVSIENEQKVFPPIRKRSPSFGSMYSKSGRYILVSKEQVARNINGQIQGWYESGFSNKTSTTPKELEDEIARSYYHEAMHAYLAPITGMSVEEFTKKIKPKGSINMGKYVLNEQDYSWAKVHQLHELGACGFGLANVGSTTLNEGIRIARIRKGTYELAAQILLKELYHSPSVNSEMKNKVLRISNGGRIDYSDYDGLFDLMYQIPNEELQRIGERMAKLAIHLAQ